MDTITFNVLPENFRPLPVIFHSASDRYQQHTMEYSLGKQHFHQILLVLEGKGTFYCNNEKYELKRGCAFFTQEKTHSKYINEDGLVTAFLTVNGDGIPMLLDHFNIGEFLFYKSVNTEKYLASIKQIIREYYETKNESTISALCYSFYISFFEHQKKTLIKSPDKAALYIEKNFAKKLSLDEIAKVNDTSVSKLCHDFKSKYGYTVFQHILNLRLSYANNLLNSGTNIKIKDIAQNCGFDDVSYFCRAYKSKFGTTPSSANEPLN